MGVVGGVGGAGRLGVARQVGRDLGEVAGGAGGERPVEALVELGVVQAALREVLAQGGHGVLAFGVTDAEIAGVHAWLLLSEPAPGWGAGHGHSSPGSPSARIW